MPDMEERLERCFAMVFPELRSAQIRSASTETVEDWDSLASITLAALIEEEFAIKVPADDLPSLLCFQDVVEYLKL